jgi:hypothetical protein
MNQKHRKFRFAPNRSHNLRNADCYEKHRFVCFRMEGLFYRQGFRPLHFASIVFYFMFSNVFLAKTVFWRIPQLDVSSKLKNISRVDPNCRNEDPKSSIGGSSDIVKGHNL